MGPKATVQPPVAFLAASQEQCLPKLVILSYKTASIANFDIDRYLLKFTNGISFHLETEYLFKIGLDIIIIRSSG